MSKNRPISLIDEIRMHVLMWLADDDFKKINPNINQALTTLHNELKIHDALVSVGAGELKDNEQPLTKEKRIFIAIFKQKYLENIDLVYDKQLTPPVNAILTRTIEKLLSEGTNSQEFLEWLWGEFFTMERNKKYLPPDIAFVCSSWIVDKFLFLKKDSLRVRKKDLVDIGLKNKVIELAVTFLKINKDKDFGEKLLVFSRGELTITKFCEIFKKCCDKYKDKDTKDKIEEIFKI